MLNFRWTAFQPYSRIGETKQQYIWRYKDSTILLQANMDIMDEVGKCFPWYGSRTINRKNLCLSGAAAVHHLRVRRHWNPGLRGIVYFRKQTHFCLSSQDLAFQHRMSWSFCVRRLMVLFMGGPSLFKLLLTPTQANKQTKQKQTKTNKTKTNKTNKQTDKQTNKQASK